MYIKNIYLNIVYKFIFVIISGLGLYLDVIGRYGHFNAPVLNYYTIQSNLICFIFFLVALIMFIKSAVTKKPVCTCLYRIESVVVFCIIITLIIYQFVLAPTPFKMSGTTSGLANTLVHLVIPLMAILDAILFNPKGYVKNYDPLLWLCIPALYFVYILIRAQFAGVIGGTDSKYPYEFIDVGILGWGKVWLHIFLFALFFGVLGYIYYFVDRMLGKKSVRKLE